MTNDIYYYNFVITCITITRLTRSTKVAQWQQGVCLEAPAQIPPETSDSAMNVSSSSHIQMEICSSLASLNNLNSIMEASGLSNCLNYRNREISYII